VSFVLMIVLAAALMIQLERHTSHVLSDAQKLSVFALFAGLGAWWQISMVPRFCKVRLAAHGEKLNFPVSLVQSRRQ
jgi:hypothetical protein